MAIADYAVDFHTQKAYSILTLKSGFGLISWAKNGMAQINQFNSICFMSYASVEAQV